MTLALRHYQSVAVEVVRELWSQGKRRVVLCCPTGGGKTHIFEALTLRIRAADWAAVAFCAHTSELVLNPADRLAGLGVDYGLVKAGYAPDEFAGVQVCSAASLVNRPLRAVLRADGTPHKRLVLVIDEAHRCRATTYERILRAASAAYELVYVLLLTATPYRRDGRGMAHMADALYEAVTPRELTAAGVLVDPTMYSRPVIGGSDDDVGDLSPRLAGDVVETWLLRVGGRPTILRAANRAHARSFVERFTKAGVRAASIDGTMSDEQRGRLLGRLAIGGVGSTHPLALDVLCSGGTILEEGYDSAATYRYVVRDRELWDEGGPTPYVPLACLVDAAPTTSRGAWIQRLGRVARAFTEADVGRFAERGLRASVKRGAVVCSHAGNLEQHGFLLQHERFTLTEDRVGAKKSSAYPSYKPPRVVECAACFASSRPGYPCRACGTPTPGVAERDLPSEDASIDLEEARLTDTTPPVATEEDKERYLRGVWSAWRKRCANGRATKPGWVGVLYRKKFGSYPDHSLNMAIGRSFGWDGRP